MPVSLNFIFFCSLLSAASKFHIMSCCDSLIKSSFCRLCREQQLSGCVSERGTLWGRISVCLWTFLLLSSFSNVSSSTLWTSLYTSFMDLVQGLFTSIMSNWTYKGNIIEGLRCAVLTLPPLHLQDQISGSRCRCLPGFSGKYCQNDPNPCHSTPCLNGGQCVEKDGKTASCICHKGYTGIFCEVGRPSQGPVIIDSAAQTSAGGSVWLPFLHF